MIQNWLLVLSVTSNGKSANQNKDLTFKNTICEIILELWEIFFEITDIVTTMQTQIKIQYLGLNYFCMIGTESFTLRTL